MEQIQAANQGVIRKIHRRFQINDSSGLIQSVLPFAPISMPIASTKAAEILNKSLSDQIELKLEKFINK